MKKKDVILIAVLLIAAIAAHFGIRAFFSNAGGQVVITSEGSEIGTYALDVDNVIEIRTDSGYNKVVISGGQVDVTEADCPDKICADHAPIHYNHETIVCLPHKLVVEVIGGENSEIDVKTN